MTESLQVEFESAWRVAQRRQRRRDLAYIAAFLLMLTISFQVGEVRLGTFLSGLPELGDYFVSIAPDLHGPTLGPDLGECIGISGIGRARCSTRC